MASTDVKFNPQSHEILDNSYENSPWNNKEDRVSNTLSVPKPNRRATFMY